MGSHIVNGEFQSDKYPTCPPGKVPLSVKDPMAQDLLWEYARRRVSVDAEFSADLMLALSDVGYKPPHGRCFKCQPTAMGMTVSHPSVAPTCDQCGQPCAGGHWVVQ